MSQPEGHICINNVKVSFRLDSSFESRPSLEAHVSKFEHKFYSNFCVVRWPRADKPQRRKKGKALVATVFFSGFCNVTGIRRWADIEKDVNTVCRHLNLDARTPPCVDNISASGRFCCVRRNFFRVVQTGLEGVSSLPCFVSYNAQVYPGLFLQSIYGTVVAYQSGKCVLVGSKTLAELSWLVDLIKLAFDLHQNGGASERDLASAVSRAS